MCLTVRQDYGLNKQEGEISAGLTSNEKLQLTRTMSQVFDNVIKPLLNEQNGS